MYKTIFNALSGRFDKVFKGTLVDWKDGVPTVADLPAVGNTKGDARITNDNHHLHVWNGSVWVDEGDIIDLKWASLEDKPTSAVADIDDAVTKKHTQNTDEYLNTQVTKTLYVDKNRTDIYTENGSITKPYKSINNLLTAGVPTGAVVKIAPGYYSEDVDFTGLLEVVIIGDNTRSGDGTRIQGTVTVSGIATKVSLKGVRVQPTTDKIALDYIDGDNCYFQDCVFRNGAVGAIQPIIRIGDVVSGGGLGPNVPRFYNCSVPYKEAGGIIVQGANLAMVSFVGGYVEADISMIGAYGVLLDHISGSSNITHNISVLAIERSQIGSLTSAVTATPANAFISLDQITLRANDGITVGSINLNGTCPYVMGLCDYNIAGSNFGAGTRIYNSFDRDLLNTSSVVGATVKDALETLKNKSDKSVVFTNTIILQANGANYETINHALAEQFIQATVSFKPSTGTYSGQWINGEGVLTMVYHDANNIRLYNDSGSNIAIGDAKIIIQK